MARGPKSKSSRGWNRGDLAEPQSSSWCGCGDNATPCQDCRWLKSGSLVVKSVWMTRVTPRDDSRNDYGGLIVT